MRAGPHPPRPPSPNQIYQRSSGSIGFECELGLIFLARPQEGCDRVLAEPTGEKIFDGKWVHGNIDYQRILYPILQHAFDLGNCHVAFPIDLLGSSLHSCMELVSKPVVEPQGSNEFEAMTQCMSKLCDHLYEFCKKSWREEKKPFVKLSDWIESVNKDYSEFELRESFRPDGTNVTSELELLCTVFDTDLLNELGRYLRRYHIVPPDIGDWLKQGVVYPQVTFSTSLEAWSGVVHSDALPQCITLPKPNTSLGFPERIFDRRHGPVGCIQSTAREFPTWDDQKISPILNAQVISRHLAMQMRCDLREERKFIKIQGYLVLLVLILLSENGAKYDLRRTSSIKNRYAFLLRSPIGDIFRQCLSERDRRALSHWGKGPAHIAQLTGRVMTGPVFDDKHVSKMRGMGAFPEGASGPTVSEFLKAALGQKPSSPIANEVMNRSISSLQSIAPQSGVAKGRKTALAHPVVEARFMRDIPLDRLSEWMRSALYWTAQLNGSPSVEERWKRRRAAGGPPFIPGSTT
ncbi:MAG: hypothetical protein AAF355_02725 [Myxococcota bacterium]